MLLLDCTTLNVLVLREEAENASPVESTQLAGLFASWKLLKFVVVPVTVKSVHCRVEIV